jgi:hypothetical protein
MRDCAFVNLERWREAGDPDLRADCFIGSACVVAVEPSGGRGEASRVVGFTEVRAAQKHYFVFSRFCPASLSGSPGDAEFTRETIEDCERYGAGELAYDPWIGGDLAAAVGRATSTVAVGIAHTVRALSSPMKEVQAAIEEGRLHHDGDPLMAEMIGNVAVQEDARGNVFPQKIAGERSIGGVIAMIMLVGRLMRSPDVRHAGC